MANKKDQQKKEFEIKQCTGNGIKVVRINAPQKPE